MNHERVLMKGQLAEAKDKLTNLEVEAKGLILIVRQYLNPYEPDITRLKIDQAASSMERLNTIHQEMVRLKKLAGELDEALHG